jgi:hypothetical protein
MKVLATLTFATASSIGLGCASRPPPSDHLASAVAAVRGAQVYVASAGDVPDAALQLKLAEEQVAQARKMIGRGDNERADYMSLRAFNDAELALALVRQHRARQAVLRARQRVGDATPSGSSALSGVPE